MNSRESDDDLSTPADPSTRAADLREEGVEAYMSGEYERALELLEESLELTREQGDRESEAETLWELASIARTRGEFGTAETLYAEILTLVCDLEDVEGEANCLANLGGVLMEQGDYDRAAVCLERGLKLHEELGDREGQANVLGSLGLVAQHRDEPKVGAEHHRESLEIYEELGNREEMAAQLGNLGLAAQGRGEYEEAERFHFRSLELEREVGNRHGEAQSLGALGQVAREQGKYERAQNYFEAAAEIFLRIHADRDLIETCVHLVRVSAELNDPEPAAEWCSRGLEAIERSESDFEREREVLESVLERIRVTGGFGGGMLSTNGQPTEATAELYGQALINVLNGRGDEAMKALYAVWSRREAFEPDDEEAFEPDDGEEFDPDDEEAFESDDEVFPLVLAAGVGFAAHTTLFDTEEADADRQETLDAIEPHRERLPEPAAVVFEHLVEGEAGVPPEELREEVPADPDEIESEHVEPAAFARLLEILTGAADVVETQLED